MMSKDRELLEMAAKAAGLGEVWYLDSSDTPYVGKKYQLGQPVEYSTFSPLTDDGDALRLAVKLKIHPETFAGFTVASFAVDPDQEWSELYEWGDDPYAATRRVIVRAAAEIGKAMP